MLRKEKMKKILFVCQANIGRSQMAEAFYNQMTNSNSATSAACEDFREKYGGKITKEIVETMSEVGLDLSQNKMKLLTPKMIENSDKVIVLCDKKYCPEFLFEAGDKVVIKTIEDPHAKDSQTVSKIRDQIKKIVKDLV